MCPWVAGPGPGLADLRVKAEVADELARVLETVDVADRREERRGDDHVHAGHAHQPRISADSSASSGDQPLDLGDLAVEELDLAHRAVDALALLGRQLQRGQPLAALTRTDR